MIKEDLALWTNRKKLLIIFQEELNKRFNDESYNIFIFGSYITPKFNCLNSDIDLVVYSQNQNLQYEIAEFSKKYWEKAGLESDILIYFYSENATIFFSAINYSLHMTDYYPNELKNQLYKLYKIKECEDTQKKENDKHYQWYYEIKKRRMEADNNG